jgi:hypothetical protein
MHLAEVGSPAEERAMLNVTSDLYEWAIGGITFVKGVKFGFWCGSINNYYTAKLRDYRMSYAPCGAAYYSYCEYNLQPRSEILSYLINY